MKFIVCGNLSEFYDYCRDNQLNPKSKEVKYVSDRTSFFGAKDANVIYYGTYFRRKDLNEIQKQEKITRY